MLVSRAVKSHVPTEAVSLGEFIAEELVVRGWTIEALVARMDDDARLNQRRVEMLIQGPDCETVLDKDLAAGLGKVFGLRPEFFLALHEAGRRRMRWG